MTDPTTPERAPEPTPEPSSDVLGWPFPTAPNITFPDDLDPAMVSRTCAENDALLAELGAMGIRVNLSDLIMSRLFLLTEWLLGRADDCDRQRFEYHLAMIVQEQLLRVRDQAPGHIEKVQAEARRAALLDGVQLRATPNGATVPVDGRRGPQ
jgi:hypothetical protein